MSAKDFVAEPGKKFRLENFAPEDTGKYAGKEQALAQLEKNIQALSRLQSRLYADGRYAVLIILQAMDAAGKDSAIKHVMSGLNPQGCAVTSFKQPSAEELGHTFLWRCLRRLPERGSIGIFNRSYYEEVLISRVHPELLAAQKIPERLVTGKIWDERFEDINAVEKHLARNGTLVVKIFLHLSRREQKERFLKRLEAEDKNWKFSAADVEERRHWDQYMDAYEQMIRRTSTKHAPWHIVPADHKWYTHVSISEILLERLGRLDLEYPRMDGAQRRLLLKAARALRRG